MLRGTVGRAASRPGDGAPPSTFSGRQGSCLRLLDAMRAIADAGRLGERSHWHGFCTSPGHERDHGARIRAEGRPSVRGVDLTGRACRADGRASSADPRLMLDLQGSSAGRLAAAARCGNADRIISRSRPGRFHGSDRRAGRASWIGDRSRSWYCVAASLDAFPALLRPLRDVSSRLQARAGAGSSLKGAEPHDVVLNEVLGYSH